MLFCSPYACGVSHLSHVLFAAYHKARPSRAINEDVYYYYYYYDGDDKRLLRSTPQMSFNPRNIWADAVVVPAEAENVCQPHYYLVDVPVVSGSKPAGRLLDYE